MQNTDIADRAAAAEQIHDTAQRIRENVGRVIVGADDAVTLILVALLSRGLGARGYLTAAATRRRGATSSSGVISG